MVNKKISDRNLLILYAYCVIFTVMANYAQDCYEPIEPAHRWWEILGLLSCAGLVITGIMLLIRLPKFWKQMFGEDNNEL